MSRLCLLTLFALVALSRPARAVSVEDGRLLTSLVASAAAKDPRVDVLTTADLRAAVDLAADKTMAGCDAQSCLADIAAAMDAAAVLHGTVGVLGDQLLLNLSLFDSAAAASVGRATARASDVSAMADGVNAAVTEVLAHVPLATGKRVRVLVLDLEVVGAAPAAEPGLPLLSVLGIATAAAGATGLGIAGVSEYYAGDADNHLTVDKGATSVRDVDALIAQRRTAVTVGRYAWPIGGVLLVGGLVLVVVPLVVGE